MSDALLETAVVCPYCGESFTTLIDLSAGDQELIEDCYVCCSPIDFRISIGADGAARVLVRSQDE